MAGRTRKRLRRERDEAIRLLLEYEAQIERYMTGRYFDFVRLPSNPAFLARCIKERS